MSSQFKKAKFMGYEEGHIVVSCPYCEGKNSLSLEGEFWNCGHCDDEFLYITDRQQLSVASEVISTSRKKLIESTLYLFAHHFGGRINMSKEKMNYFVRVLDGFKLNDKEISFADVTWNEALDNHEEYLSYIPGLIEAVNNNPSSLLSFSELLLRSSYMEKGQERERMLKFAGEISLDYFNLDFSIFKSLLEHIEKNNELPQKDEKLREKLISSMTYFMAKLCLTNPSLQQWGRQHNLKNIEKLAPSTSELKLTEKVWSETISEKNIDIPQFQLEKISIMLGSSKVAKMTYITKLTELAFYDGILDSTELQFIERLGLQYFNLSDDDMLSIYQKAKITYKVA